MRDKNTDKNPILYEIDGIPIRAVNRIYLQYDDRIYANIVKASLQYNVSINELLRIMSSPCQICGNDKIVIPLNIITHKVGKSGRKIKDFHKPKDNQNG